MKPKRHPDSLLEAIAPLAKQVAAIQVQMRTQGLFPHDRELLECPEHAFVRNKPQ